MCTGCSCNGAVDSIFNGSVCFRHLRFTSSLTYLYSIITVHSLQLCSKLFVGGLADSVNEGIIIKLNVCFQECTMHATNNIVPIYT